MTLVAPKIQSGDLFPALELVMSSKAREQAIANTDSQEKRKRILPTYVVVPEEIFVVSGRLYDAAFDLWLEPGYYASRPPGEVHGHFVADGDVTVLEISYPSQAEQRVDK